MGSLSRNVAYLCDTYVLNAFGDMDIQNIKALQHKTISTDIGLPECEDLVRQMRKDVKRYVKSVILMPKHYVSFNSTEQMLKDLVRFCVQGNSTILVDTTFQLTDGLWLTDSSFPYEALLNENGEHPTFPEPYMWHKSQEVYRYIFILVVLS